MWTLTAHAQHSRAGLRYEIDVIDTECLILSPSPTVYRWFARFRDDGTLKTINHHLVGANGPTQRRGITPLCTAKNLPFSQDSQQPGNINPRRCEPLRSNPCSLLATEFFY